MGITGLWQLLEPTCQPVTLESLEGKKLAVDVSIWIYQAQLGYSTEVRCPHLALLISRLCKLLFYKIRPVFVFDGPNVPVLKRRVLEERRLRKHNDDIMASKAKKRHLEDLARGPATEAELENIKKKLASPTKRLREPDEQLYDIPSTSSIPVVELSDDEDADIIVEKEVAGGIFKKSQTVEDLIDARERIRVSRLHPDMIPKDTDDFCQFQLQRLLNRNKLNRHIKEMSKHHEDLMVGSDVKMAVRDADGKQAHVISRDDDGVEIVEPEDERPASRDWGEVGLTLDHLTAPFIALAQQEKEEDGDALGDVADVEGRMWVSKSTMIEDLMRRRIGQQKAQAVRKDSWSSTDSDDDDFVDVPFVGRTIDVDVSSTSKVPTTSNDDSFDREWNPALEGEVMAERKADDVMDTPASERDPGAYRDLQEFLSACGFPWIEAPGEAEAQCVELERLGLVEGVVSDDSDVWAFGANDVYRHLFSKAKNVQHYEGKRIAKQTGLSQSDVICVAMLSGGDYSPGIRGVGVVSAIELLAEFATRREVAEEQRQIIAWLSSLEDWLFAKKSDGRGEPTASRRKLRSVIERDNELEQLRGLANPEVVTAYLRPRVDSSTEPFRWKTVDIARIRQLVHEKLGWDEERFQKMTLSSLEKWNDFVGGRASYQRHMTSYSKRDDYTLQQSADEQKVKLTKRVREALQKLASRTESALSTEMSLICQATFVDEGSLPVAVQPAKKRSRRIDDGAGPATKRGTGRRGRGRGGVKQSMRSRKEPEQLNLSEESSDEQ